MSKIDDYSPVVGGSTIEEPFLLAERLKGKTVQHINSTPVGGGVAEILTRIMPLLRDLGVNAWWDVIKGNERFFSITKKIHNALHGVAETLASEELDYLIDVNRQK